MRVLLYINLIAILVVMAALGRMYEGTPLPWKVDVLGMVAGDSAAPDIAPLTRDTMRSDEMSGALRPRFVLETDPRIEDMPEVAEAGNDGEPVSATKEMPLRVLTEGAYLPFNGRDRNGELTGYDVDMAKAVCARLKRACVVEARSWKELLPSLVRGDADLVIASMLIPAPAHVAPKPDTEIVFTTPYYTTPGHFAALLKPDVQAGAGLSKQRIVVQGGTAHEAFVKQRFADSDVLSVASLDAAVDTLAAGHADLVFADRNALLSRSQEKNARCCRLVGPDYDDVDYFGRGAGMALRASDKTLLAQVNEAIETLKRDGTSAIIARRYFGQKIF